MASKRVYVDFGQGAGWEQISSLVRDTLVIENNAMGDDFHYSVDTASFSIKYDGAGGFFDDIASWTDEILVKIDNGSGTVLFTGRIPPTRSERYDGVLECRVLDLEALDFTKYLEKKPGEFVYTGDKLMDPADTTHSVVHKLFTLIGLSSSYIDSGVSITTAVDAVYSVSEDETVLSILDTLLYEYGYVIDWNNLGKFSPKRWAIANGSATAYTFDEDNIVKEVTRRQNERTEYQGSKVTWYELGTKTNVLVYRENLPYDSDGGFAGYSIVAGTHFPVQCNVVDETTGADQIVYQEYQDVGISYLTNKAIQESLDYFWKAFKSDFSEIIKTENHTLDVNYDTGIILDPAPSYQNRKACVRFTNPTGGALKLYYFNIYADVTYKSAERTSKVENVAASTQLLPYSSRFLFNKTLADAFAKALAMFCERSPNQYTLFSEVSVAPGTFVELDTNAFPSQDALVASRRYEEETGLYEYTLIGFGSTYRALTHQTVRTGSSVPDPIVANYDIHGMRFEDAQNGYDAGGGTTTPSKPVLTVTKTYRDVYLTPSEQLNLTNFDHFEYQISADGINWYSFGAGGDGDTDWRGVLNTWTTRGGTSTIHVNLPFTVVSGLPTSRTLQYRVRVVTKAGTPSSESDAVSITITPADIPASAIGTTQMAPNSVTSTVLAPTSLAASQAGLAAYWSCDENGGTSLYDQSGNGNTGTIVGCDFVAGISGKALRFDNGISEYVVCQSVTRGQCTVSLWVKLAATVAIDRTIVGFAGTAGSSSFYVRASDAGGGYANTCCLRLGTNNLKYWSSVAAYCNNAWHHWVLNITGATQADISNAELWIDGVQQSQFIVNATGAPAAWSTFTLARSSVGYLGPVGTPGYLDEVRYFTGVNLTKSQIQTLYMFPNGLLPAIITGERVGDLAVDTRHIADLAVETAKIDNLAVSTGKVAEDAITAAKLSPTSLSLSNAGLAAYWSCDENSGTSIYDQSGNGNTGTITAADFVSGISGKALRFDNGAAEYVICQAIVAGKCSFSFWMKLAGPLAGATRGILALNGVGDSMSVWIYASDHAQDPNRIILFMSGNHYRKWDSIAAFMDNAWHHYVVNVYGAAEDDIQNAELWIDGSLRTPGETAHAAGSPAWSTLAFGKCSAGPLGTVAVPAYLDEIRYYTGRNLTQAEIRTLKMFPNGLLPAIATGDRIGDLAVDTRHVLDDAINAAKLAAAAVRSEHYYENPTGYNCVINSDFETGDLDGWSEWVGFYALPSVVSVVGAKTGAYAIQNVAGASAGTFGTRKVAFQRDRTYIVEVYAKALVGSGFCYCGVREYDATDTWIRDSWTVLNAHSLTGSWVYYSAVFDSTVAHANTTFIRPAIVLNNNAQALCQDQAQGLRIREVIESVFIKDAAITQAKIGLLAVDNARIANATLDATKVSPTGWIKFDPLGLVGYWSIDDPTATSIKNQATDLYHGTPTALVSATGRSGLCATFNGASSDINCGDIDALDGLTGITVCGWMKSAAAGARTIIAKEQVFVLDYGNTANKIKFWVYDGSWHHSGDSTTSVNDGSWHFVVGTYDGSYVRIYVDGVQENSGALASAILTSNAFAVHIGNTNGASEWFSGQIDEVRAYNRALSQAEILYLYFNPAGLRGTMIGTYDIKTDAVRAYHIQANTITASKINITDFIRFNPTGLAAYWSCDDGVGTSLYDQSGNNNTGTITGADFVAGRVGQCLRFNDGGEYVTAQAITLGQCAFSFWFNDAGTSAGHRGVLAFREIGLPYGLTFLSTGSSNKCRLLLGGSNYRDWASIAAYHNSQWHHCVVNITGAAQGDIASAELWIDGLIQTVDTTDASGSPVGWVNLILARNDYGAFGSVGTPGYLDEVRYYTGRNLTQAEIQYLYLNPVGLSGTMVSSFDIKTDSIEAYHIKANQLTAEKVNIGSWLKFDPLGLKAYWSCDEGTGAGTTIYDQSGNGHNGTIGGGAPTWVEGKAGKALQVTALGYVQVPSHADLCPTDAFGLSFWIKPTGYKIGYTEWPYCKGIAGDADCNLSFYYFGSTSGMQGLFAFYANVLESRIVVTHCRGSGSGVPISYPQSAFPTWTLDQPSKIGCTIERMVISAQ